MRNECSSFLLTLLEAKKKRNIFTGKEEGKMQWLLPFHHESQQSTQLRKVDCSCYSYLGLGSGEEMVFRRSSPSSYMAPRATFRATAQPAKLCGCGGGLSANRPSESLPTWSAVRRAIRPVSSLDTLWDCPRCIEGCLHCISPGGGTTQIERWTARGRMRSESDPTAKCRGVNPLN